MHTRCHAPIICHACMHAYQILDKMMVREWEGQPLRESQITRQTTVRYHGKSFSIKCLICWLTNTLIISQFGSWIYNSYPKIAGFLFYKYIYLLYLSCKLCTVGLATRYLKPRFWLLFVAGTPTLLFVSCALCATWHFWLSNSQIFFTRWPVPCIYARNVFI